MDAIKRILIPTDFTPCADRALRYGTYLARQFEAEVHVLHVLQGGEGECSPGRPDLKEGYRHMRRVAETTLATLLSATQQQGLRVQQAVLEGAPAPVIVDYIARHQIDLTVMGTHGRQGTERFLIGSTAERVVRFARSWVLTVGPHGEQDPERVQRILVPVDFSDQARAALRFAQGLAERVAARLELLHVIEPLPPVFYSDNPLVLRHQLARLDEEAGKLLQAFAEETGGPSVPAGRHAVRGRPAHEIAAFAGRQHIDLIVQSSRGRTDEEDLVLGSVAVEVVSRAPCPVLTVKGVVEGVRVEHRLEAPAVSVRTDEMPGKQAVLRIERILHATDFSAYAEAALPCALNLARHSGARLQLLHVAPVFGDDPIRGAFEAAVNEKAFYRHLRDEADERMQAMLTAYDDEGIPIERIHSRGPAPGETITAYVEDRDVDVVVIGTQGRRGLKRLFLGSVAQEIIRRVGCPVLAVRERDTVGPAGCTIRRILAPIDFSVHSIEALAYAKALAALFEATLDCLHVLDPTLNARLYGTGLTNRPRAEQEEEEKAYERLSWLSAEVGGPSGLAITHHIVTGYPPVEITRHAEQQACDLIVMATHGLTGLQRFPLGGVTGRVLQLAACPVFITKPFGKSLFSDPGEAALEILEQPGAV